MLHSRHLLLALVFVTAHQFIALGEVCENCNNSCENGTNGTNNAPTNCTELISGKITNAINESCAEECNETLTVNITICVEITNSSCCNDGSDVKVCIVAIPCESNHNDTVATTSNTLTSASIAITESTPGESESIENMLKDEESAKNEYQSRKENDRIIFVVNITGTNLGDEENPVYSSNKSSTKVYGVEIASEVKDARVVVLDSNYQGKVNVTPDDTLSQFVQSTNTQENVLIQLGSGVLSIGVYSGSNKVPVTGAAMDIGFVDELKEFDDLNEDSSLGREKRFAKLEPICAFLDGTKFSIRGCRTKGFTSDKQAVQCEVDHATSFAVLLSAKIVTVPTGVKMVSFIAEVTSIFFLLITGILLAKVRNHVRGDRVKVQICVTFSLLILHILNVLGDVAVQNATACEILAVLIHFFLLSTAMWMLMEGLTLACKTMDSVMIYLSGKNARKFAIFRYVASWSIPGLIVIISVAIGFSNGSYLPLNDVYGMKVDKGVNVTNIHKYYHCWIGPDIIIYAVIIPVAVIMSLCVLIIVRMAYIVFKMSSESENYRPTQLRRQSSSISDAMELEHVKAALKAIVVLLPVVGVPWILGFFTAIEEHVVSEVFMYINVIINGLQGIFLFIVYCILGKEVRMAIGKSYARKKYKLSGAFEFTSKSKSAERSNSAFAVNTGTTHMGADSHVTADSIATKTENIGKMNPSSKLENGTDDV